MYLAEVLLKLIIMTALPIMMTVVLKYLKLRWAPFRNCSVMKTNIIVGVLFGLCAVYGTEFGVNTGMAILNTRDASVICAGLFFGGPAGMIAAVIGSVERFLCPLWGVGAYTRWACSVATLLAGVLTFFLRYRFFEKKSPNWSHALAVGVFAEVLHMLLFFLTHANDIYVAFNIVKSCSGPMIVMNGLATMTAAILISVLEKNEAVSKDDKRSLNTQFNIGLFLAMFAGFIISIGCTTVLEHSLYIHDTEKNLKVTISDVEDQIAYASDYNLFEKSKIIYGATKYRHIYQNGHVIVAESGDKTDFDLTVNESELHKVELDGVDTFYMFKAKDGYSIIATVSVEEAKLSSELSMYIVFFMEMIVFALMFINVFYLVKALVLDSLKQVNVDLKKITDGELDTVVKVNKIKEFRELSDGINSTVDRLKTLIDEANKKIDEELEMAKQIQASSVPTVFPKHSDGEIYALMDTAKEVGGDFYDFFFVPPCNLYILIADVSGKGIPAALFMMNAKTLIKNLTRQYRTADAGLVLTEANETLCESNDAEMFVTCWLGCVNLKNGHVTYANAGHNKPVIKRKGQDAVFLDEKVNFILAGMEGTKYQTQEFDMKSGDTIFLYTDGFTEATNTDNQLFGNERLLRVLSECPQDPEIICKELKEAVDKFTGEALQFDDMTELAFMYK